MAITLEAVVFLWCPTGLPRDYINFKQIFRKWYVVRKPYPKETPILLNINHTLNTIKFQFDISFLTKEYKAPKSIYCLS